mgnify:CR=1 FL=1
MAINELVKIERASSVTLQKSVNSAEKPKGTYSGIASDSEHQDLLVAVQTSTLTGFTECRTFPPLVPEERGKASESEINRLAGRNECGLD